MPTDLVDLREAFANQNPVPFPLTPYLWLYADQYVETLRYKRALPLLLQYGKRYKAEPYAYPATASLIDRCYDAAYAFARRDHRLLYCEGFLCYRGEEKVLAHGWCMTRNGRIVDPTLHAHQQEDGLEYYGFPLNLHYVMAWCAAYGYLGLLDGHVEGHHVGLHYDSADNWLVTIDEGRNG